MSSSAGSRAEVGGGELGATGAAAAAVHVACFPGGARMASSKSTATEPSLSPIDSAVPLCVRRKQLTPVLAPGAFQMRRARSVRSLAWSGTFFQSIVSIYITIVIAVVAHARTAGLSLVLFIFRLQLLHTHARKHTQTHARSSSSSSGNSSSSRTNGIRCREEEGRGEAQGYLLLAVR